MTENAENRQDHDQRFKTLIEIFLRSFCTLFFEWVDFIDWDTEPEWLKTERFVDPPQGKQRRLDLVAKVRLKQPIPLDNVAATPCAMVLIHIEIESGDSAADIARRMYEYTRVLETHGLPIVPIVLLLSVAYDGIGEEVFLRQVFGKEVLTFRCWRVGLRGLNAEDYLHHAERLGAALAIWMRSQRPRAELVAEALRWIVEGPDDPARKYLLFEAVEAYADLADEELEQFQRILDQDTHRGVKAMNQTSFERGFDKGVDQGIDQGYHRLALRMLRKKFGELPEQVITKIESMGQEDLEELVDRVFEASTLADLGLLDTNEPTNA